MSGITIKARRVLAICLGLACWAACSCGYPREYLFKGEGDDVTGIEITVPARHVRVGGSLGARLLLIYSSGEKQLCHEEVTWESSDPGVASVDGDGLISAVSQGTAQISARRGSFSASFILAVDGPMDCSMMLLREILYDAEGEPASEYIEIENRSDCECEVAGWSLVDGQESSTPFIFPGGSVIAPRSLALVAHSRGAFPSVDNGVLYGDMKFTLNNGGEAVFLYAADGSLADCVYLEGGTTSFPAPDGWGSVLAGRGLSVQRLPSDDTDTAADWVSGEPTPGR